MANFPALTRRGSETHNPVVGELRSGLAHDPTIRSLSDGGYVTTWAKFTRRPRRWNVAYRWLSKANKNSLRTFMETTVAVGAESFSWTNPEDSVAYTVRFFDPLLIEFTPEENANNAFFSVSFTLEQV